MKHTARGLLAVRLTPADVGKRVSVRTDTGMAPPAPRFTDTVGVLTSWSNGVLSVTIPVSEKAKPRKIEVASDQNSPTIMAHENREEPQPVEQ